MLHVVLAGLTTGHKIGLAVVGVAFIAFALSASFLAPRKWPNFPGEHGLSVFVIASVVMFAAMVTAVLVFGREKKEEKKSGLSGARVTHVQSRLRL